MSIQHIREKYQLPVKIRSYVKLDGQLVKVVYSPGAYLMVRLANGKKETRHPFDFDYCIDGRWVTGDELKRKYDHAWDVWNGRVKAEAQP